MRGWTGFLWAALIFLVAPMILFVALMIAKWPGPPDSCLEKLADGTFRDGCYCEELQAGAIKQPMNTLSNLVPILVGLGLLVFIAVTTPTGENPMTGDPVMMNLYAGLVIFLGPGSMYFHASMSWIGAWLDNLSMNVYLSFILVYNVTRLIYRFRFFGRPVRSRTLFWILYAGLNVVLSAITLNVDDVGSIIFAVLFGLTMLTILQIHMPLTLPSFKKTLQYGIQRDAWPWLIVGLVTYLVATVIWFLSHTDRAWCDPDSALQGHGIWHVLGGLAAGCFFFYFRSEKEVGLSQDTVGW